MRPHLTAFRILISLLTVWCPGCASVGVDQSASGMVEAPILRSGDETLPRQHQLEPSGCFTEQSDTCCEWPCLTCCRYLPTASFQIQADRITAAAPAGSLVVALTLPDTPPLVRPPILL